MFSPPQPLATGHGRDSFNCGNAALNDWLVRYAVQSQSCGSAKTFVVTNDKQHIMKYFSLTVGQIDTLSAPVRFRQGMEQYPLPVVILARLAVTISAQG